MATATGVLAGANEDPMEGTADSPGPSCPIPLVNLDSDSETEPMEDLHGSHPNHAKRSECFHVHVDVQLLSKEVLSGIRDVKESLCSSIQRLQDALECLEMEDLKISLRERRSFRGHLNLLRGILIKHINAIDRLGLQHPNTMKA